MLERVAYRLTAIMNRWSSATPTACCGACKPCVTEAATNLVVVAAGVGLEAASAKGKVGNGKAAGEPRSKKHRKQ